MITLNRRVPVYTAPPVYWWDTAWDRRLLVQATNPHTAPLYDHRLHYAAPLGIDPASLRVLEGTVHGSLDRAYDHRYGVSATDINHLPILPASVDGVTLTWPALGAWPAGETRYWHLYWQSAGGVALAIPYLTASALTGIAGRTGPDADSDTNAIYQMSYPLAADGGLALTPYVGRSNGQLLRLFQYKVSGDATQQRATSGTIATATNDGPTVTLAGTVLGSTRAGGRDWDLAWTCTQEHRFVIGRRSDDVAVDLRKWAEVLHLRFTLTCQRDYLPTAVANNVVTSNAGAFEVCALCTNLGVFTGNTTEANGNRIASFYQASGGSLTAFAAAADLSGLAVADTVLGFHGNTLGLGILVNSCTLSGFGSQAPEARWAATNDATNPRAVLQLRNLSSGSVVPAGAQIIVDLWLAAGETANALTVGDNLLPDEVVALLRSLAVAPTVSVQRQDWLRPAADTAAATLALASEHATAGVAYFQAHALANTGLSWNSTYQRQMVTGAITPADDDDGSYGEAHKLHGLVLRYLRTHDSALVALIENQVGYFLALEAALVAAYGAWWLGAVSYWPWPSATSSGSTYTLEGGCAEWSAGNNDLIDPAWAANYGSYALGPITYAQTQPRRRTSIDQLHNVAMGLWAYLALLRGESAITGNTALRANALAYLGRMRDFEAAHYASSARVVDNAYALAAGLAPTHANGITRTYENAESLLTLTDPYWGVVFGPWQVLNGNNTALNPSSNSTLDRLFGALWAPGSERAGVLRFLRGRAMDMLTADLSRHDVVPAAALASAGTIGTYPPGYSLRSAATGNVLAYSANRDLGTAPSNAGYSADHHWVALGDTGARDHFSGRAAQRASVLAFLALLDPGYAIPLEQRGTTTLRSVPVTTALDDALQALALYGLEPGSEAQRFAVAGYYGKTSNYDPQVVDPAFTGYGLEAYELGFLVQQQLAGADPFALYYNPNGMA